MRGLAAVELALMMPVFLFLMTATAEIGRAMYQYNTLAKGVRDGAQYIARYGVITGTGILAPTPAQLTTAQNLVVYGSPVAPDGGTPLLPNMTTANVTITLQAVAPSATNNQVTLVATYTFQPLFGFIPGFGLGADFTPNTAFTEQMVMSAL